MKMNGSIEILIEAKERISSPKCWTQGIGARDINGNPVRSLSDAAARWCAMGAIDRCFPIGTPFMAIEDTGVHDLLRSATGTHDLTNWNDDPERTHDEVMDAFDQAIALAREKEELSISPPEIAAHEDRDP